MKYLIMVLEAPSQSWGLQGLFERRDTMPYPTKSGVVGLLGNAMGIFRDDHDGIATLANLKMSVFIRKEGSILTDYHVIGGGHKDPRRRPLKPDGKKSETVITHREYLWGASFVVILAGDEKLIQRCATALDNPKWGTYLGRRCCIPTRPVLEIVLDSQNQINGVLERLGVKMDLVQSDGKEGIIQQDVPIDFKNKKYGSRLISSESIF